MKIRNGTLNIGRKRDPQGNYVVVLTRNTYMKVKDIIEKLNFTCDDQGDIIFLKTRKWSEIDKLIKMAKGRDVKIVE